MSKIFESMTDGLPAICGSAATHMQELLTKNKYSEARQVVNALSIMLDNFTAYTENQSLDSYKKLEESVSSMLDMVDQVK